MRHLSEAMRLAFMNSLQSSVSAVAGKGLAPIEVQIGPFGESFVRHSKFSPRGYSPFLQPKPPFKVAGILVVVRKPC
jgi:hypothetical protein